MLWLSFTKKHFTLALASQEALVSIPALAKEAIYFASFHSRDLLLKEDFYSSKSKSFPQRVDLIKRNKQEFMQISMPLQLNLLIWSLLLILLHSERPKLYKFWPF